MSTMKKNLGFRFFYELLHKWICFESLLGPLHLALGPNRW